MKDPQATRKLLLQAAFKVIYRKGFKAASLNDILTDTGLTKGALYHHFPNKQALGLALLDAIEQKIEQHWLQQLVASKDPLSTLQSTLTTAVDHLSVEELTLGCPLNNLAQEMSSLDESFRRKVVKIYQKWQAGVERALQFGQEQGMVNSQLNVTAVADFYVASLAGGRGLAKTTRSAEVLQNCVTSMEWYLESLRPKTEQFEKQQRALT